MKILITTQIAHVVIPETLRIKYVDKTTNSALISAGSAYSIDDLKVTADHIPEYTRELAVDTSDSSVVLLTPLISGDKLTLEIYRLTRSPCRQGNLATNAAPR